MTARPHIYTLTGNLLAERTLETKDWTPGGTYRAVRETFQVGGKGINVSKMLNRLGVANTALCFVGGAAGTECATWLHQHGFNAHPFATAAATRQGCVVRAPTQRETTFLGPDAAPDAAAIEACAAFLDAQPDGQVLALCGSFPGWTSLACDPLRAMLSRWNVRGTLVADTYGTPLEWIARQPIALLKINATEFQSLVASGTRDSAAQRWVITDGPHPVRIREQGSAETTLVPPAIKEVSPTGSGDVLFACVIEALFCRRQSLRDAVNYALPYAAANAAHQGIAEFSIPL